VSEIELGIGLQGDRPMVEYGRLGRIAEELGFAVVTAFGDAGYLPPVPILLEVARNTERVRLGPSCLNPYTTHPVEIASQIAALDAASGGRGYVGLAKGAWLETIGIAQ
jgi:5,10-methylenetetrahydromethanopterin reductase